MDIYDEIRSCAEHLKKLIQARADSFSFQTVQVRLQALYNEEMERRKEVKKTDYAT